jgi:zinc protease
MMWRIFTILLGLVSCLPTLLLAGTDAERSILPNGLVLVTSEQRTLPIVSMNLMIRAGSRYDPEGDAGVANLTSRLLTYGTTQRDAMKISGILDHLGASLGTDCGIDLATVDLNILKKDLDVGLNLVAELLTDASFPVEEIERVKQALLASIKAKNDRPRTIAHEAFMKALYPDSPYGRPVEGTEDSVGKITRQQILEFYRHYYRPDRSTLVVVGDVSHKEMAAALEKAFAKWERDKSENEETPKVPPPQRQDLKLDRNLTQANIVMGHEGLLRTDPDFYAVRVMNHILGGGGLSSRLGDSIRNEHGLAYSVYSYFSSGKHVGSFQIAMQTKNNTAQQAIALAKTEMERIRKDGVTDEELQEAKDYLIGSFPLRLDTNRRIAGFLGTVEYLGLGLDYPALYPDLIRAVTKDDVRRVANKYLRPDNLILVVVGNLEKAGFKN